MQSWIQHLFTGDFRAREGSLYSRVTGLWLTVLQLIVSITLAARGWMMYRWDSNIRAILWDEELMTPIVDKYLGMSWDDYAWDSDPYITQGIEILGVLLMAGAFLTLLMRIPYFAIFKWALVPLWSILALDAFGNLYDVHYDEGMLIEFLLQVFTPLLFLWVLVFPQMIKTWGWLACVFCASCFIGHGLYAVGYHPVPVGFQQMTMDILKVDEDFANGFLYLMGVLDFGVAIGVLIPQTRRFSLYYMVLWGLATALARPWAYYAPTKKYYGLDPWLAEFFVRTAHWMIPLLVLMLLVQRNQNGRLTLGLLEISSQTRRVLSKASILKK